jgi:hypothetical protein
VEFFDFDHLPELSDPRTIQRHLDDIAAHLNNPKQPVVFD